VGATLLMWIYNTVVSRNESRQVAS